MDYSYYRDAFGGTAVSEEDFPRLAQRAEVYIQYLTAGRSAGCQMDAVRDAVCAVCEVYAADRDRTKARGDAREIASENNDGWSVSYVTEGQAGRTHEETLREKAYQAAYPYLVFTGLLYRGCG